MTIERNARAFNGNGRVALLTLALTSLLLSACTAGNAAPQAPQRRAATPAVREWTLPTSAGMQPALVAAPDGALLLSWVEETKAVRRLRMARWQGGRWSPARTVASGESFGSGLDTPRVDQTADGTLWAAWLRKSPAGGHATDVVLTNSRDSGGTWSKPVAVNTDRTATEHGFASLWRAGPHDIGVVWLDGRATAGDASAHGHAAHDTDVGAMQMLRAVRFDRALSRHGERVIDATVCDCCHTDVAQDKDTAVLVYRDRTRQEVRDVRIALLQAGAWQPAGKVHADNWVMPGCPVNGPAAAVRGQRVASVWYTGVGGTPSVRYALSGDGGRQFASNGPLDRGDAVIGRVDAAADATSAVFSWLREDASGQSLWLRRVPWTKGGPGAPVQVAQLHTHGLGAGMPRLAAATGGFYLVWTDVVDGKGRLTGRMVALAP